MTWSARRRVALGGIAVAAGAGAAWVMPGGRDAARRPDPALAFTAVDGRRILLADLRGQVVLVNFWATTCTICLNEMPAIAELHRQLAPRGLATIAVAMPDDRPDFVTAYARRAGLPFPVAVDPDSAVLRALGPVRGTPTLLVVDRGGAIASRLEGAVASGVLRKTLERQLASA